MTYIHPLYSSKGQLEDMNINVDEEIDKKMQEWQTKQNTEN
jgi:hypothetical protein